MEGGNAAKQKCPQGHDYDAENTYYRPDGGRGCKACRRKSSRAYYWRTRRPVMVVAA